MKKPRKPRPKAKQLRATKPAAATWRASTSPTQAVRLEHLLLRSAKRRLTETIASGTSAFERGLAQATVLARRVAPHEIGARLRRLGDEARGIAIPYSRDEREALALLFLPFLLVASAIVVHQSVRTLQSYLTAVAVPDVEVPSVRPGIAGDVPPAAASRSIAREATPNLSTAMTVRAEPETRSVAGLGAALEAAPIGPAAKTIAAAELRPSSRFQSTALKPAPVSTAKPASAETKLALLAPVGEIDRAAAPVAPDSIEALDVDDDGHPIRSGICAIDKAPRSVASAPAAPATAPLSLDKEAFGLRLAEAAESQVGGFVIYNDDYRSIAYPMGDVNGLFGVCTDVIVRAYRAMGLDLQTLVHQARSGSGDTNIDQRRTEVLRRFFAAQGESLPVTSFAEDYRPGDIVTYYRPQNRHTRAHIAIVSSVVAPSGRLMIVHNRGWGPQLEDALFVDQITGHYRYTGPAPTRNAANGAGDPPAREPGWTSKPAPTMLSASFPTPSNTQPSARH